MEQFKDSTLLFNVVRVNGCGQKLMERTEANLDLTDKDITLGQVIRFHDEEICEPWHSLPANDGIP